MKDAMKIAADGTSQTVAPAGKKFTLEEMQGHVGGYIAPIPLPGKRIMLVDEDGMPKGLPVNPTATEIAGQRIVGPVLVMPRTMF